MTLLDFTVQIVASLLHLILLNQLSKMFPIIWTKIHQIWNRYFFFHLKIWSTLCRKTIFINNWLIYPLMICWVCLRGHSTTTWTKFWPLSAVHNSMKYFVKYLGFCPPEHSRDPPTPCVDKRGLLADPPSPHLVHVIVEWPLMIGEVMWPIIT